MTPGILLALWMTWNDAGCEALQQGKYTDAAIAFRTALSESATALDADAPETAMLWRNLSIAYTGEGLYKKAEQAASTSLRILEERFGRGDPSLVPSLNALGESLAAGGRFTEARPIFERAVNLNLGGPHGATALHNLAAVAHHDGRTDKARQLYREALQLRESIFGRSHSATLATRTALRNVQVRQSSRTVHALAGPQP